MVRSDDERWAAVQRRAAECDGQFCYSVRTTGVFCRPSCGPRTPHRENVRFHATCAEAEAAGFRPCKRCRPNGLSTAEQRVALVAAACRQLESAPTPPSLGRLAEAAGLSPSHFHRVFREVTGITPKAYAQGHRAERVRESLGSGAGSVTDAIYDAGFGSNGRFYATSTEALGMTPTSFRAGGADAVIRFAAGECSMGAIVVAATDKGICAILLGDDAEVLVRDLQDRFPRAELLGGEVDFEATVATVIGAVEAPGIGLDLPLDLRGTAFQQRVWQALRDIPAGTTASYTDIAARIGAPTAARAVAGACASNAIAVAIPCHRVVRSDGGLSGYRWGIERKRALLEREAAG